MMEEEDELDLTNFHLDDEAFGEVILPQTLVSVDLTANRLRSLDKRLLELPGLQRLILRQNLLEDASALGDLACSSVLEHLVLHDNQLTQLPPLGRLEALRQLEVSYNEIRSMAALEALPSASLLELYAACNKITQIQSLEGLTNLRTLELGGNRVTEIAGLDSLGRLEELWLGRNRITSITNLNCLGSLKKLALQSNRLLSMAGLHHCTALEELYLSHNGIRCIQGLEELTRLEILDVSTNQVQRLQGLSTLTHLKDLWVNDNAIESLEHLAEDLQAPKASLTCIYLSGNPAVTGLGESYRATMKTMLPLLEQLDGDMLTKQPIMRKRAES